MGIDLTNELLNDDYKTTPAKECKETHIFRVANGTLKLAIDVHTDFECDSK